MIKRGRILFYHPGAITGHSRASGTTIRPRKMLEAFKRAGYTVDLIIGTAAERSIAVARLKQRLENCYRYEFLYAESHTMPCLITDTHHLPVRPLTEVRLFKLLKRNGVRIGWFHRDMYWRLPQYKCVPLHKRIYAKLFYWIEWWILARFVDIMFLPTEQMKTLFPTHIKGKVASLPPGADEHKNYLIDSFITLDNQREGLNLLYVGGVTPPYYDLRPAFTLVRSLPVTLTVCCRREEWAIQKHYYEVPPNVCIVHCKGEDLERLYVGTDLFLMIFADDRYRNLAMPLKFFEALSFLVPVVTLARTKVGQFVQEERVGWLINGAKSFEKLVYDILSDRTKLNSVREHIMDMLPCHTWVARAAAVASKLVGGVEIGEDNIV